MKQRMLGLYVFVCLFVSLSLCERCFSLSVCECVYLHASVCVYVGEKAATVFHIKILFPKWVLLVTRQLKNKFY